MLKEHEGFFCDFNLSQLLAKRNLGLNLKSFEQGILLKSLFHMSRFKMVPFTTSNSKDNIKIMAYEKISFTRRMNAG